MSLLNKLNALNAVVSVSSVSPGSSSTQRQLGYAAFLAALEPGRHLRATVQSSLPNGEFLVALEAQDRTDGQLWHMKLPSGIRSGDLLNLIFVSRNPRPAFMLMGDRPDASVSAPLSATGRFLSNLLSRSAAPGSLTASSAATPLLAAPPAGGVQLAQSLGHAISQSGLFYESHQAQWIAGERPIADLLLEPQAFLSGLRPSRPDTAALTGMPVMSVTAGDNAAEAHGPHAPVHPDALALVRQQLEVFETRQIGWQGLAWPGQTIEWAIAEEKYAQPDGSDESDEPGQTPAAWQTRVNLTLPNLGQISASLRLDARGVAVRLTAADPVTAFVLRAGAKPLANGMECAGIALLGMGVDLDEAARSV